VHETRLRTQAEALVGSLESTESPRLPDLIKQLEPLRVYASPRLRQLAKDSGDDSSLRLRVGLALLPDDPKQVDYLYGRLDSVSIDELLVMRTALANYRDQLVPRLSNELQLATSTAAQRVRRGCLLAAYDPDNPQWKNIVGDIARFFVAENPLVLGQWTKAFEPVQELLIVPLAAIFRDENRPETERVLAATVLAEYGGNRASLLANLVQEAEPRQFSVLLPVLREQQDAALPVLWAQLSSPLELNSSDAMQDASARRQARSAVALLQLGMTDILPALFERHDPRLSSYLMHYLSGYGVPASIVIADLKRTREPSARHFLILSLGEYSEAVMPLVDRAGLTQDLLADYHNDSDPGIHGALDWLLRQRWGLDEELTSIERERAGQPAEGRGWLVDKQGSTFVIFRNPGRFTAGSPETEPGHDATEGLLEFQLEHVFALSNREVTVEEFQKFLEANPQVQYLPPPVKPLDPREPARNVTWFQAAQYCRWRSEQEGLVAPDSEDSCYPPLAQIKLSMGLKPGFLKRPGYRLPLDLEWEFACRAGTRTSRFYGHDRKLLDHYAWSLQNSQDRPASVGMLKPNRFGLFDMYGNVWEWTHDYRHFSAGAGRSHYDDSYGDTFPSENRARGGSYLFHAPFIRSAKHYSLEAERGDYTVGFRLARTLPAPQLDQP
ncbi:MAG: formylglycine-generating enzyme family protein, partial [Planctomycetes bacterium]|nr:formylglycine-generating enzyme family protein [Planctomycetota bacterium]